MLSEFLKLCTVLDVDGDTAQLYGEMIAALYKKGRPLPTNDVWIAAIAKQHDLVMVTRDKHFKDIDGINAEYW